MAQQVKGLAVKLKELSSNPGTHTAGDHNLLQVVL